MIRHPHGFIRLSSRVTWVYRFIYPALALGGSLFAGIGSGSTEMALVALLFVALFVLFYWKTAYALCNVWAGPHELLVVRGTRTARIPYGQISDAKQRHDFGYSEILLESPSVFGTVILFVPYSAQFLPYQGEHPADLIIRHRSQSIRDGGGV